MSLTNTQYGNVSIGSDLNANIRGSGMYDPPPNNIQTIDRGKAFQNALNVYENKKVNGMLPQKSSSIENTAFTKVSPQGMYESTTIHQNSVGSSNFYMENNPNQWNHSPGNAQSYASWALKSVQLDPNQLALFFFSPENVDYLQKRLYEEVFNTTNVRIGRQSDDELLIIMRNHYMKALAGWLPRNVGNPNAVHARGDDPSCTLEEKLTRLNKSVLEEVTQQVLSGINMNLQYYSDASSLPLPLERPQFTSMKGSRVLSESVGFTPGHEMTNAIHSYNERYNVL